MQLKDLLGQKCTKCREGVLVELSLSYTARVTCTHCKAVFQRLLTINTKLPQHS